jgi:serine/threonine protein kinase
LGPLVALLPCTSQLPRSPPEGLVPPQPTTSIAVEERGKIALHVALGIEYLHANNLVHGSLSPHTVYVDEQYNARVAAHMAQSVPIEVAVVLPAFPPNHRPAVGGSGGDGVDCDAGGNNNECDGDGDGNIAGCGCAVEGGLRWQAPEVALCRPITFGSDVFAFGMVLWSLHQTEKALPHHPHLATDADIVEAVRASGGRLPVSHAPFDRASVPQATASLSGFCAVFEDCTKTECDDRPSAAAVAARVLDLVEGIDRWEVDRRALTVVEKLGEGQFGDVLKMATTLFSDDGALRFVAVKRLKSTNLEGRPVSLEGSSQTEVDFLGEIGLMKRLRHPNLVTLLGVCTREPPFLAVLEFLTGGSLDIWLPENGHKLLKPTPTKLVGMLHQIALGCQALALAGIVHRDLAARNVLVDDRLHVKVADYGLSREVDEGRDYYRLATARPLPLRWTAPEALTTLTWTSASDCYSFGIVAFEMFSFGGFPFEGIEADPAFIELLMGSSPLHPLLLAQVAAVLARYGASVPPSVAELVRLCTVRDPSRRPTFDELARLTASRHYTFDMAGNCSAARNTMAWSCVAAVAGSSAVTMDAATESESRL